VPTDRVQGADCQTIAATSPQPTTVELPGGSAATIAADGAPAEVHLRRFADSTQVSVGTALPGEPMRLDLPADGAPEPWVATLAFGSARVCTG
jgi:hypothetical protein